MTAIQRAWGSFAALALLSIMSSWVLISTDALASIAGFAPRDSAYNFISYLATFSGWIALVLLFPTFLSIWGQDYKSRAVWLAFWTVSMSAFLVYVGIGLFLHALGEPNWMHERARFDIYWPSILLAIWWLFDVVRAWTRGTWVTVQRMLLHIIIVMLFVETAGINGELLMIKILGWSLLVISVISFYLSTNRRRAR